MLLEVGCLQSISIPPIERFYSLTPKINSVVNEIQVEHMVNVSLQITPSPRSAISPNSMATHFIKLYTKTNPENHVEFSHHHLQGLPLNKDKLYQYQL